MNGVHCFFRLPVGILLFIGQLCLPIGLAAYSERYEAGAFAETGGSASGEPASRYSVSFQFSDPTRKELLSLQLPHFAVAPLAFTALLSMVNSSALSEPSVESLRSGFGIQARKAGERTDTLRPLGLPYSFLVTGQWNRAAVEAAYREKDGSAAFFSVFSKEIPFYKKNRMYKRGESEFRWRFSAYAAFHTPLQSSEVRKESLNGEGAYLNRGLFSVGTLCQLAVENSFFWNQGMLLSLAALSMDWMNPVGETFFLLAQQKIAWFSFWAGVKGVSPFYSHQLGRRQRSGIDWMGECRLEWAEESAFFIGYSRRDSFWVYQRGFLFPASEKFRMGLEIGAEPWLFRCGLQARGEVSAEGEKDWKLGLNALLQQEWFRNQNGWGKGRVKAQLSADGGERGRFSVSSGFDLRLCRLWLEFDGGVSAEWGREWKASPLLKMAVEAETAVGRVHLGVSWEQWNRTFAKHGFGSPVWLQPHGSDR